MGSKFIMAAFLAASLTAPTMVSAKSSKKTVSTYEIPTPPEGQGQIIFYRTGAMMGAALGCSVNKDGERLSSLGLGKYFRYITTPGEHTFMAKSEAKDFVTVEVEPDETEFVRCKIKMGFMVGRPNLGPSSEKEFRKKYKKPKLVDADDMTDEIRAINYPELADAEDAVEIEGDEMESANAVEAEVEAEAANAVEAEVEAATAAETGTRAGADSAGEVVAPDPEVDSAEAVAEPTI